jgi:hypothetical protein
VALYLLAEFGVMRTTGQSECRMQSAETLPNRISENGPG